MTSSGTEATYEYCRAKSLALSKSDCVDGYGGGTDCHDPLECAWLTSGIPPEAVESIIIPEMLGEENEKLWVQDGQGKHEGESPGCYKFLSNFYAL